MLDNANSPPIDPLGEDPSGRPRSYAALDDVLADDLRPDDIVFIDDKPLRFLSKRPGHPHVFWDGEANAAVEKTTIELLKLRETGRYYRAGRQGLADPEASDAHRETLRVAFQSFAEGPKRRAEAKWLYVQEFVTRIRNAKADGFLYARNGANAIDVVKAIDGWIDKFNEAEPDRMKWIVKPRMRSPRSVLRWVERELETSLQEAGQLHKNAVKARERELPQMVYDMIAETIREMVWVSSKLGPKKIWIQVTGKIGRYNVENEANLPLPSPSLVRSEYRRYDAWTRMAVDQGKAAADLEYGGVGKLVRPARILDLVELDHHKFDFHAVFGKTPFTKAMSEAGLDRFWICLALDVHSGYPLGFSISYEPGGLLPALACIDHAIAPKTYVRERWPHIQGDLLGFGKPVRFRYDNGKEFVSLKIQAAIARIGVGFQMAVPKKPKTKPYVERHFGTLERDFIHWLKGSTGSGTKDKGGRVPVDEARLTVEDFVELFHQWLIEVFARRPQKGLDWETPEQRWIRGVNSPSHRPRPLTPDEQSRWDLIASIDVDIKATKDGFRWKNLDYQSPQLQAIRRAAGCHGQRVHPPTPLKARISLRDISKAYVAVPKHLVERFRTPEILVPCLNPHVAGRGIWHHEVVCDFLRRFRKNPSNHADYEEGFRRLFTSAMAKMGVRPDGAPKPERRRGRLTGGQAPRFAGVLHEGQQHHALKQTDDLIRRYDIFGEIAAAAKAKAEADAKDAKTKAPKRKRGSAAPAWTVEGDPLDEANDYGDLEGETE